MREEKPFLTTVTIRPRRSIEVHLKLHSQQDAFAIHEFQALLLEALHLLAIS